MTDVVARDMTPHILRITSSILEREQSGFSDDESKEIRSMTKLLEDFTGQFTETSVGATVYSYW